jgi:hypothetical protein
MRFAESSCGLLGGQVALRFGKHFVSHHEFAHRR